MALPSSGSAHAGFENLSDGHVWDNPGPGAGWECEFSATLSELPVSGCAADLENQEPQSPVVQGTEVCPP